MSEWREYKIGDMCVKVTDGAHNSPSEVTEGYPMFSVKDMDENGFNYSDVKLISRNDYDKLVKSDCKPLKNDVLIAKDGSYLKHVFVCEEEREEVILSSIAILRPNQRIVEPHFLKYILKTSSVKTMMEGFVSGSALPRIVLKDFKKMVLQLPKYSTQQRIAFILSAYDYLIENNYRRIAYLEQMAEQIYKEWFVRMRFPGYENTEFEKGVPKGWKYVSLGSFSNILMGQSPKSEFYNDKGDGLPFHQGVGSYGNRFPIHDNFCSVSGRLAKEGDILFSVRAPVGRINIANKKLIIGRGLAAIRHKNDYQSFLFYLLNNYFQKEDVIGNGAIFNSVGKDELNNFKILYPMNFDKKFNEIILPIDIQIKVLIEQNQILKQTRDLLLPRLISGKLRVKE